MPPRDNKKFGRFAVCRSLLYDPLWLAERFTRGQALVDLIGLANHGPKDVEVRGNLVHTERGQVAVGERTLAERWKWGRGRVRRFLVYLTVNGTLVPQTGNVKTVLTLCNYNAYQFGSTADSTADGTADSTADGTASLENLENKKKTTPTAPAPTCEDVSPGQGSLGYPSLDTYHDYGVSIGLLWTKDHAENDYLRVRAFGWTDGHGKPIADWRAWLSWRKKYIQQDLAQVRAGEEVDWNRVGKI